ncbi:MAG: hydroxysqualene dehydroxylase HpnE [Zoogloeaceae bacterium]|jgi:squalene-associated FAD-dependent desaturase|nr:hydroxysqualene dehydroxylase HpnE [Zoogloeaceae bacterium]
MSRAPDVIAIVGGGWAGIAAAVELAEHLGERASIHLLEAGRRLGGRARSTNWRDGDFGILDEGQHMLLGAYRETLALMRRVGVAPETVLRRLPLTIRSWPRGPQFSNGNLPAPLGLCLGLLRARGIGWREKYHAARFGKILMNCRHAPREDQGVTEWLAENGQTGTLRDHFWRPLCLAALNTPPERASARLLFNVLHDSLGSREAGATDLLLPVAPLSQILPDPAADWLRARGVHIHLGTRVRQLRATAAGWQLRHREGEIVSNMVILAVAPQHLPALATHAGLSLPDYQFEPIGTLYFRHATRTALPFPLMALAGGMGQWLVDRGNGILAASLSGRGAWTTMPKAELAAALHREIAPLIGGNAAVLPPCRMFTARRATFSATPGLIRVAADTPWPTLWIAGDHTWRAYPATLEGAVRSGLNAARQVSSRATSKNP